MRSGPKTIGSPWWRSCWRSSSSSPRLTWESLRCMRCGRGSPTMSAKPGNAERDAVAIAGRPWDRQPNESPKAFEAFAIYRDLGVYRDQRAVALAVKKQRALLGRWSVTYEWVSRVSAWDAWNDAESRKLKEAERRKALDDQLRL